MNHEDNPLKDWRGSFPSTPLTLPDKIDLASALDGFDFAQIKREIGRRAERHAKLKSKVPPAVGPFVEEAATSAASAAGNPRSGMKGVRAAKEKLRRRLTHRGIAEADVKRALRVFDLRWPEIFAGPDASEVRDRVRKWA